MQLVLVSILSVFTATSLQAQTYVNKEWVKNYGSPDSITWSASTVDVWDQVITVTSTSTDNQRSNILITKFEEGGSIDWQEEWNDSASKSDYGTAVITDGDGNIYVAGAANYSNDSLFDIVLLKYNYLGVLQWEKNFDGTGGNDYPTKMAIDLGGYIYVTGASEGTSSDLDYITLKYDFDGDLEWSERYDHDGLKDIPADIVLTSGGSYIAVTGGSENADTAGTWDYTTVLYDQGGTEVNVDREPAYGSDLRKPRDIVRDAANNYYITGIRDNGTDHDIRLIKLDSTLNPIWVVTYDQADEGSNALALDQEGNIYIGGWQGGAGIQRFLLLKYDSTGALQWDETLWPDPDKKLGEITHLKITDEEIAVLGISTDGYNSDIVTAQYDVTGDFAWQQIWSNTGASIDLPAAIEQVGQDVYVSGRTADSTGARWVTLKYSFYERDTSVFYSSGRPVWTKHELIVCFDTSVVNRDAVDNGNGKEAEFGSLDYFLEAEAVDAVMAAMDSFCNTENIGGNEYTGGGCTITMLKVFRKMKTTDTITISRLGEKIPIPPFWANFVLVFPEGTDVGAVANALDTLFPLITYVNPNIIIELDSEPNDTLYELQYGFDHKPNTSYAGHINVEPAWEIEPGGKPFVKVGVFDSGLDWEHVDFGYNGNPSSSKVKGGWNYKTNLHLKSGPGESFPDLSHGTGCGGIIGAIRNNEAFIAGIAGGNFSDSTDVGASLYGFVIYADTGFFSSTLNYVTEAIINSSTDTSKSIGFGLHISNNSWSFHDSGNTSQYFTDTNLTLFREAVHFANRAQVTYVATRGNEARVSKNWPGIIDDDWVLTVSATDGDGNFMSNVSSSGWEVDVAAPGTTVMGLTLREGNRHKWLNATSLAAPHISGTAALLMSYLNDSVDSYKNLAPEDVEYIIQESAIDVSPSGPDSTTGHGRLDAGAALNMVRKDSFLLMHYATDSFPTTESISLLQANKVISIPERYMNKAGTWHREGTYLADVYIVTMKVYHNLQFPWHTIEHHWERHSSSNLLPLYDDNNVLVPRERIKINYVNTDSASLTGYIYKIKDSSGSTLGWWPFNYAVDRPHMAYSLLQKLSNTSTSLSPSGEYFSLSLYPNPSSYQPTLSISNLQPNRHLTIKVHDLSGRLISQVFSGLSSGASFTKNIDISSLKPGCYLLEVTDGDSRRVLQLLKQ